MKPHLLALGVLFLAASGCKVDVPPIKSGFVSKTWVTPDSPRTELSWSQLKQLADWFAAHEEGWTHKITDTPPGTIIVLQHNGGKVTWVNLTATEIWIGNRFRVLTAEERAEIQAILNQNN